LRFPITLGSEIMVGTLPLVPPPPNVKGLRLQDAVRIEVAIRVQVAVGRSKARALP
jgi:hypothetical protein